MLISNAPVLRLLCAVSTKSYFALCCFKCSSFKIGKLFLISFMYPCFKCFNSIGKNVVDWLSLSFQHAVQVQSTNNYRGTHYVYLVLGVLN
jgi:hypothetical protein